MRCVGTRLRGELTPGPPQLPVTAPPDPRGSCSSSPRPAAPRPVPAAPRTAKPPANTRAERSPPRVRPRVPLPLCVWKCRHCRCVLIKLMNAWKTPRLRLAKSSGGSRGSAGSDTGVSGTRPRGPPPPPEPGRCPGASVPLGLRWVLMRPGRGEPGPLPPPSGSVGFGSFRRSPPGKGVAGGTRSVLQRAFATRALCGAPQAALRTGGTRSPVGWSRCSAPARPGHARALRCRCDLRAPEGATGSAGLSRSRRSAARDRGLLRSASFADRSSHAGFFQLSAVSAPPDLCGPGIVVARWPELPVPMCPDSPAIHVTDVPVSAAHVI